jgi:hypothetical protein
MQTFGERIRAHLSQAGISARKADELSRKHSFAAHEPNLHISRYRFHELMEDGVDISYPEMVEVARLVNRPVLEVFKEYLQCYPEMAKSLGMELGTNLLSPDLVRNLFLSLPAPGPRTGMLPALSSVSENPLLTALWPPGPNYRYGMIGFEDFTMAPLLPPSTLLRINTRRRSIARNSAWNSPYDRPIYFLEIRGGHACGWCEMAGANKLALLPYDSSRFSVHTLKLENEVNVVGRVVGHLIDDEFLEKRARPASPPRST